MTMAPRRISSGTTRREFMNQSPRLAFCTGGARHPALQFVQRQVRHDTFRPIAHYDLVGVAQDLLHGFEIHAARGDLRVLEIGLVNTQEALCLTLGLVDDAFAVGVGFLNDLLSITASAGQDIVAVGLRLVAEAVAVLQGALHVVEGVDHLLRRLHLLQLHLGDLDARFILVHQVLQQVTGIDLDVLARFGQRPLNVGAADDLAHRRLGRRLHGGFALADVEEVLAGIGNLPEDREVDIDDVLVAGQHQAFFGHVTSRRTGACGRAAIADFDRVDGLDRRRDDRFDRIGQMPVEAGFGRLNPLAEAENDALFIRLHPIETGQHPEDEDRRDRHQNAATTAKAARYGTLQALLAATYHFLQIGRALAAEAAAPATTAPAPGPAGIAGASSAPGAAAAAAAGLPRHTLNSQFLSL